MTISDKVKVLEVVNLMFMLIHTKCEIATANAKQQGVPKYLFVQSGDLQHKILELVEEL
jgi:hypothetical protein